MMNVFIACGARECSWISAVPELANGVLVFSARTPQATTQVEAALSARGVLDLRTDTEYTDGSGRRTVAEYRFVPHLPDFEIAELSLDDQSLPIDGPAIGYGLRLKSNVAAVDDISIGTWIEQGGARRAGGSFVLDAAPLTSDCGASEGRFELGECRVEGATVAVSHAAQGFGTFQSWAPATVYFELRRAGLVVATHRLDVKLVDAPEPPPPGPTRFVRGDANGDGGLDISDATFTLIHLFRRALAPGCEAAQDTNGDATVNVSDAIHTIAYLFQGGNAPRPPFPACGPATLDGDILLGCATPPAPCR